MINMHGKNHSNQCIRDSNTGAFVSNFFIILGGTLKPNSLEDISHSDLISGFKGDFLWPSMGIG